MPKGVNGSADPPPPLPLIMYASVLWDSRTVHYSSAPEAGKSRFAACEMLVVYLFLLSGARLIIEILSQTLAISQPRCSSRIITKRCMKRSPKETAEWVVPLRNNVAPLHWSLTQAFSGTRADQYENQAQLGDRA